MRVPSRPFGASLRGRVRDQLKVRVRAWVDGNDALYDGDPRRRIDVDPTSVAPIRLLQYGERDGVPVTVGKYCVFHQRAVIMHGGNHRIDWVSQMNVRPEDGDWNLIPGGAPVSRGPVVIGNDVWIGYEALIFSGLTIGDGAVIGARAVVTRSVEPYEIIGGNPGRHIGWRFDEPTRAALGRIRWWDWPEEKVREHRAELDSPDVADFVRRHDPATSPGTA